MINSLSSVPTKFVALTVKVAGAIDVPLSCPVDWFSVTPIGSVPTTDQVIVGDPVASNLMFNCCLIGAVSVVVVIVGAVGPGLIVKENCLVAEYPAVFVAITSSTLVPTSVIHSGIPVMAPVAGLRFSPAGNVPFSIVHVTGVLLIAANLKFMLTLLIHDTESADVIIGCIGNPMVTTFARIALPETFAALTVKLNLPALVGVPDSTPSMLSVSPGGRLPLCSAQLGTGFPVAVKLKL